MCENIAQRDARRHESRLLAVEALANAAEMKYGCTKLLHVI